MKIKKAIILPVLFLIILCFPGHVMVYYSLSAFFRVLQFLAVCYAIYLVINYRNYKCQELKMLKIWLLWSIINFVICGSNFNDLYYYSLVPYAAVLMVYQIYKINKDAFVHTLSKFFAFFIVINFITYLNGGIYSEGLFGNEVYFMGIRITINYIFLFACVAFMISFYKGKLTDKLVALAGIVTGLLFSVGEWVSTSIGASLIVACVLIGMKLSDRWPARKRIIQIAFVILVVGIVLFTLSPNVESFSWFIEDILGENLTMDGRTEIWQSALGQIEGISWIVGHGLSHNYQFALSNGAFVAHPHNQYLALIFVYGVIGLAIFIIMLLKTIKVCLEETNRTCRAILVAAFFGILVMGVSQTYYTQPYWMIWILMCQCIVKKR